jgi:predicted Zn finger-like uncharacterized protein
MTIECPSCHTRFHLDDSMFRGSKGMRVRCRKCGGAIVVMNAKAPPSPPRAEARSAPSAPRSNDPHPTFKSDVARFPSPVPQTKAVPPPKGQETITHISHDPVRLDTAGSGPEQKRIVESPKITAAPSKKVPKPEDKSIDGRNVSSRDAALPEPGVGSPQPSIESTRAVKTESRHRIPGLISPMPLHKQSILIIAALLFLLIGGFAAYLGFTRTGNKLLHNLAVGTESMFSGGGTEVLEYIIRDVSALYVPRTASEKLFVLKGKVENRGAIAGRGIRIRVILLNGTSQVLATRTFPAGHVFTDEELNHMDRARMEEVLSNRSGEDPEYKVIPPGKSLPFMALFFDLPESIASYQMTVQGSR